MNALKQRIFQWRFISNVLRIGGEVFFRFGILAEPAKFCGEGEMSAAVTRKQLAGFGVALCRASMIAGRCFYPSQPTPSLRTIAVMSKDLLVESAGLLPAGERCQGFGET